MSEENGALGKNLLLFLLGAAVGAVVGWPNWFGIFIVNS